MRTYFEAHQKERLEPIFTHILGDGEAARWLLEQRIDKAPVFRDRFLTKKIGLVSFDVDRIKDFVFATAKPLEIQGASAMVKDMEIDGAILKEILSATGLDDSNVLFAAGGSGLMLVPAEKAHMLSQEIQTRFAEKTGVGSCTAVYQVFSPHQLLTGVGVEPSCSSGLPAGIRPMGVAGSDPIYFGEIVQYLADRLREVKEETLRFVHPPLPGIIHRCESCGVEAASYKDAVRPEESQDRICSFCIGKRDRGRKERSSFKGKSLETAQSINEITGGEERGYYSIVYADANNMGDILLQLRTMVDYALFSNAVSEVLRKVTDELVFERQLKGSYQAPVIGGDDLLFIVPASKAAKVAAALGKKVKEGFAEKVRQTGITGKLAQQLKDIGMSVGFVIVPAHFAIRYALDYAEALLLSAKKGTREKAEDCIDYLVVKDASPLNVSIEEMRISELQREGPQQQLWKFELTRKPLTLTDFERALENVAQLQEKRVPRSQLYQIETLLRNESPKVASLLARCQLIRVDAWRRFGEDPQKLMSTFDILGKPAAKVENYESGFLDLMELYEFAEESNG